MRRAAVVALALVALVGSVVAAYASSLSVNAGYLQTLEAEFPGFQPPQDPDVHEIHVVARRFNSGKNPSQVGFEEATATFSTNQTYLVGWTGGSVVPCSAVNFDPLTEGQVERGPGEYTATGDGNFTFCVQTGTGELSITLLPSASSATNSDLLGEPDVAQGHDAEKQTTSPSAGTVRPDDIPDFVGENCQDGGWQQLAAADGQPYADEQACVDDQVRAYYDQQREGES